MDRILIGGGGGEVLVGRGLPPAILPERAGRERAVVVHQPPVRELARAVAAAVAESSCEASLIEIPDREEAKGLTVVGRLYDRLAELNLGRHDTVVAVGGGAATDVSGFVAATWLRGIESVFVPTTLLAAVDASIGGKTGINHAGKNLVGAFWHPTRVVVDLDVIAGLPEPLLVEGSAEILKAGYIADPEIVAAYRRDGLAAPLEEVVTRAIRVKAEVVGRDFREAGERAILNFGHTVGHAVETAAGIPHGHAVAVGMVAAGAISGRRHGFDPAGMRDLIASLGLPVDAPDLPPGVVMDLVAHDKKRTADGVRMVLLRAVGDPVVERVTAEDLVAGLAAVGIAE